MLYVQYPSWLKPEIVPGFPVRWYGLMYLLAFATAYIFTIYMLKREKDKSSLIPHISNLVFWAILGILIGGRLVSEVIYSKNPGILIKPWLLFWPFDSNMNFVGIQGMSYHGGLIGGFLGFFFYCKKHHIAIWELSDIMIMGSALGYFFGRMGNFANAELYGRITASPFGMIFPYAQSLPYGDERVKAIADKISLSPDASGLINLPRHPSQLYEAFSESLLAFLILYIIYINIRKTKYYAPGMFCALYLTLYGIARFIVEYFRQPDAQLGFIISLSKKPNPIWLFVSPFNISMGQILSFVMIVASVILLFIFYKIKQKQQVI